MQMNNVYVIDSGKKGPTILITAGVHGDEYEPIIAAQKLSRSLEGKLVKGKVIIVPNVNQSAVELNSRFGADGLDLARTCPGDSEGSETQHDAAFISEWIKNSDALIDLHTGGRILDIHPLAGYMIHPDSSVLEVQREMAHAFGLPIIWGTDHGPNGRTLSIARDHNIPAIYVEYGGGNAARKHIVDAYVTGCLRVLNVLGVSKQEIGSYPKPLYVVEDPTPQTGFLQIKMPAPESGIFVAYVKLGMEIQINEPWGEIINPKSGEKTFVFAEENGIVLFLRAEALVKKGDSLGGILRLSNA